MTIAYASDDKADQAVEPVSKGSGTPSTTATAERRCRGVFDFLPTAIQPECRPVYRDTCARGGACRDVRRSELAPPFPRARRTSSDCDDAEDPRILPHTRTACVTILAAS